MVPNSLAVVVKFPAQTDNVIAGPAPSTLSRLYERMYKRPQ